MRIINKEFEIPKLVKEIRTATSEEMVTISEYKESKIITVEVAYRDADEQILDKKLYRIKDEYYDLLMSDSPEFAAGKPVNEYREKDLWYFIDQINGK